MTAKTGGVNPKESPISRRPRIFRSNSILDPCGPFGRKRPKSILRRFFFWFATLHNYLSCKGGILDIIIANTNSEEKFTNTSYLVIEEKGNILAGF
jgi:hypothetical protein